MTSEKQYSISHLNLCPISFSLYEKIYIRKWKPSSDLSIYLSRDRYRARKTIKGMDIERERCLQDLGVVWPVEKFGISETPILELLRNEKENRLIKTRPESAPVCLFSVCLSVCLFVCLSVSLTDNVRKSWSLNSISSTYGQKNEVNCLEMLMVKRTDMPFE